MYYNVSTINEAIHSNERISFKYLKYTIQNVKEQVEKRGGEKYVVSPFRLMINEGNYYLIGFSDTHKEFRTYRVDRMKDIILTGVEREGKKDYEKEEDKYRSYNQRVFSMYGGENVRVTIQADDDLLDTFVDRFGSKGSFYRKVDDKHFEIETFVEISPLFFGWLCGFGKKVKLAAPDEEVKAFKEYVDTIIKQYKNSDNP